MKFLFWSRQPLVTQWIKLQYRCTSRSVEVHAAALAGEPSNHVFPSFEAVGLRPAIISALQRAFPDVHRPTDAQAEFIPAIMSGSDVLLKDETGTGKSFGLILALLNKARRRFRDHSGKLQPTPALTSLFIVPHRDLAVQLFHWVQRIVNAHDSQSSPSLSSIAQVLVRDGDKHLTSGIGMLHKDPPHLLIATPQALMDVWRENSDMLQLHQLSTVVVDEVDYLVDSSPIRTAKHPRSKIKTKYLQTKISKHPGVTRELLDVIYRPRKMLENTECPQLVLSSATLSLHLKDYLLEKSGWLNLASFITIRGRNVSPKAPSDIQGAGKLRSSIRDISHSILVVSEGSIKNIFAAADSKRASVTIQAPVLNSQVTEVTVDPKLVEKYGSTPSPFNVNSLEAVATAFALDVPSVALLAIPSSASVNRAVYDLRCLGVNAHGLDLLLDAHGRKYLLQPDAPRTLDNPTLLVCTPATTRGLDLPDLTHVFILGIPDGASGGKRNSDTYLHLAGRVGRFGRAGKVITIVEKDDDAETGKWESKDSSRMLNILKRMSLTPVRFDVFE